MGQGYLLYNIDAALMGTSVGTRLHIVQNYCCPQGFISLDKARFCTILLLFSGAQRIGQGNIFYNVDDAFMGTSVRIRYMFVNFEAALG